MINTDETLGALATLHPQATAVFLRHRLDFCCRGGQKLAAACEAAGIDPSVVAAEIAALVEGGPKDEAVRWDTRAPEELIEHILSHYHEPLRHDLPALVQAARKVERVHGDKPSCPNGLADHLEAIHADLLSHMAKEEQVLFPALRSGGRGQAIHMPIRVMMQEHDDHGTSLRRTRELTNDLEPPVDACGTWRALYSALEQLEAELMQHIHVENNVLFQRALSV